MASTITYEEFIFILLVKLKGRDSDKAAFMANYPEYSGRFKR